MHVWEEPPYRFVLDFGHMFIAVTDSGSYMALASTSSEDESAIEFEFVASAVNSMELNMYSGIMSSLPLMVCCSESGLSRPVLNSRLESQAETSKSPQRRAAGSSAPHRPYNPGPGVLGPGLCYLDWWAWY
jgi:hypothetical protein